MTDSNDGDALRRAWARFGGTCGLLGIVAYALAAFAPLPGQATLALAFAFGPLLAVGAIGLRRQLMVFGRRPLLDTAAVFAVAGGVTLLSMLSVQQALFAAFDGGDMAAPVREGFNAVHYGLDVAWDVLVSSAVVLFGIAMLRGGAGLKAMGAAGIVLGLLLLGFNLAEFPHPPASQGSIDWGPFVALWLAGMFGWLWLRGRR